MIGYRCIVTSNITDINLNCLSKNNFPEITVKDAIAENGLFRCCTEPSNNEIGYNYNFNSNHPSVRCIGTDDMECRNEVKVYLGWYSDQCQSSLWAWGWQSFSKLL